MSALLRNSFELCAVVHSYRHSTLKTAFEVYPMVHLAEASFYEEVARRLEKCDAIFYEGVRSRHVSRLTRSYRWLARRRRLGLVLQSEYLNLEHLQDRVIRADLPARDFNARWQRLPLPLRLVVAVLVSPVAFALYLTDTREAIARRLTKSSLPASESFEAEHAYADALDAVVVDARDQHLVRVLSQYIEDKGDKEATAAIVFGAGHVEGIERFLTRKLKFRSVGGFQIVALRLEPAA